MKKINIMEVITILIVALSLLILLSSCWVMTYFSNPTFDQLIYHVRTGVSGTDLGIIKDYFIFSVLPVLALVLLILVARYILKNKNIKLPLKKYYIYVAIIILGGSTYFALEKITFFNYLSNQDVESKFLESNYVNPDNIKLSFPKKKRNLLVLYLESFESSYSSKEFGGQFSTNYIPNLTDVAKSNINFSDDEKVGGAKTIFGTGWTTAGFVSTMAGIPIKSPFINDAINENPFTYPDLVTIPDILSKNNYNEELLLGSTASFGGINEFFKNHGKYTIKDLDYLQKNKDVKSEYASPWGISDYGLFEIAKKELIEISKDDNPFYFNLITIDTHAPEGYISSDCKKKFTNAYANAIFCSDKHIADFLKWIKQQDFYKNTTVILMGDHLSMSGDFFAGVEVQNRDIFNAFINTGLKSEFTKNRLFSQYDYFPTILASIGVTIPGNKLGLGTNLYSGEKTLEEQYGFYYLNTELSKRSDFYNEELLY